MSSAADPTSQRDVATIRQDFPVLDRRVGGGRPLVYLDNAASTQRPRAVLDAMTDCYTGYYANVHRGIHTLSEESTRAFEQARQTIADFIGAESIAEVIFTAGTTAGINTVARSWGDANLGPGDVILLPIAEHHANIVPWHQLAERRGCRIVFMPFDDAGQIDTAVLADHLQRFQPKLLSFAAVGNVLGTEVPVARWTSLAHQAGATVLVDAAQAVPHQAVDVRAWDADFVLFSGHKMCGPTGIGVLYGKQSLLDAMPPFLGGGAMIHTVSTAGFTPAELPQKFEAGTPPIVEAIGLAAAVRYLQAIGLDWVHSHEQRLTAVALEALAQIAPVRCFGPPLPHRAGIISFVVDGLHPHDLAQYLDLRGIAVRAGHHCAMPLHETLGVAASCRASFYLYNSEHEAQQLVDAVAAAVAKFARRSR